MSGPERRVFGLFDSILEAELGPLYLLSVFPSYNSKPRTLLLQTSVSLTEHSGFG